MDPRIINTRDYKGIFFHQVHNELKKSQGNLNILLLLGF